MQREYVLPDGRRVLLTDEPAAAGKEGQTRPVIGISCPGSDKDWSGVSYLAQDSDAVDDAYADEVWRRFYGLPLILADEEDFIIRELAEKDAEDLRSLYEDPLVKKYLSPLLSGEGEVPGQPDRGLRREEAARKPSPDSGTPENWESWIRAYAKYEYASGSPALWAVCGRDDRLLGLAGAMWRDEEEPGWYLGYALLPEARGKGTAARAAARVAGLLKDRYELETVFLVCDRGNEASAAVAERIGMSLIAQRGDRRYYRLSLRG